MSLGEEKYRNKVPFSSHYINSIYNPYDLSLLMFTLITKRRDQIQCYFQIIQFRIASDLKNILKHLCVALKEWGVMLLLLAGEVSA